MRGRSVVVDYGRYESSCGYCKSGAGTRISHGLWAQSITVDDYQDLLDRGWRRSGCFLYKPEMETTCCPSFTIRLKASDFVPSKEQNRVYRRMQRFLDGTLDVKKPVQPIEDSTTGSCVHPVSSSAADESLSHKNKQEKKTEEFMQHLSNQIDSAVHACIEGGEFPSGTQLPKALVKKVSHSKKKLLDEEDLVYTSNIAFQTAATLKCAQSAGKDVQQSEFIAQKVVNSLNQLAKFSGLSIGARKGHINFYSSGKDEYLDGDTQIATLPEESATGSGSKSSSSISKCSINSQGTKKLEIRLKRSSFDLEEYALYKRYQIKVHNDTPDHVTESSYRRFLVETPLIFVQPSNDGLVPPYGTLDVKKPVRPIEDPATGSCIRQVSSSAADESLSHKNEGEKNTEEFMQHLSNQIDSAVHACIEGGEFPSGIQLPKALVKKVSHSKKKPLVKEDLVYTSNIAFQIAATLNRAQSAGKDVQQSQCIAEKVVNSLNQLAKFSGLSVRACNGHINFYSSGKDEYLDGDIQIVNLPEESATGSGSKSSSSISKCFISSQGTKKLEICLKRSSFDREEYELYKKYQIKVHNDTPAHVTESSYRRFLVDTPLLSVQPSNDGLVPPCGFGSFHQQYLIDGQLVAVGVIDILPRCLSSKYLIWDPDYAFLSLGKYSAIQEIGWVKENQVSCPSLQYYYLGYYIHSCSKMRYKAAYRPSELLCPLRYEWVPFDVARPLLDKKKYAVLSDYASLQNGEFSNSGVAESALELQQDEIDQEDRNDVRMDDDEEMLEPGFESSGIEGGDMTKILIGLRGSQVRYKVRKYKKNVTIGKGKVHFFVSSVSLSKIGTAEIQQAVSPSKRIYLEAQLQRYQKVVGVELSERMVYSLG
ncbi:hypothetical protein SLEP1_g37382 [Rubroshorea leprosula]|uniref:arginyltransferase n=1 Tax=Rubroshorea leprosula TaxID=152421 RepID=A0AAV5KV38_9ROSI|nr:hypothetical protein SLEP1_g37382 [Rubroshorea leprosula]